MARINLPGILNAAEAECPDRSLGAPHTDPSPSSDLTLLCADLCLREVPRTWCGEDELRQSLEELNLCHCLGFEPGRLFHLFCREPYPQWPAFFRAGSRNGHFAVVRCLMASTQPDGSQAQSPPERELQNISPSLRRSRPRSNRLRDGLDIHR